MEETKQVATSNAPELNNAIKSVASNELINKEADMTQQDINKYGNTSVTTEEVNEGNKEKEQSLSTTVTATIDGKQETITVAFTKYSMSQPKDKIIRLGDKERRMEVIFHFAKPEIFWNEGIELFDRNENIIAKDTKSVLVLCDTADTYWRVFSDETLKNVEVHDFKTVQEYAQAIGNTMLASRAMSNVEKVGYAALATGDKACQQVNDFAKKNQLTLNTAKLYLDIKLRNLTLLSMTTGNKTEDLTCGRTVEEAQSLYDSIANLSKKEAKKRYFIHAVNAILASNDSPTLDDIIQAINKFTQEAIEKIESAGSDYKEIKITELLTESRLSNKSQSTQVAA